MCKKDPILKQFYLMREIMSLVFRRNNHKLSTSPNLRNKPKNHAVITRYNLNAKSLIINNLDLKTR